jgi:riboflavin transporter FmnP
MIDFLDKAKRYLWLFVELAFLSVLAIILIHLILGPGSGIFIQSVADNVLKFANGVQPQALVGLAIVLALILFVMQRMKTPPAT